jgi:uncharacterized protein (DUF433 family)
MLKEALRIAFGPLALLTTLAQREGMENMALVIASNPSEPVPLQMDADGAIRIGNTRVTLDLVIAAFLDGASAEEIAEMFDTLDLGDVYSVLGYYIHHRDDIDSYLQQRQHQAAEIRAKIEARQNHVGLRDRLLA